MVNQWASCKAGGCSPGLLSHRHSLHLVLRCCALFAWAGCPPVRVYRFRGRTLAIAIVVVVNWHFRVRVFVFAFVFSMDEGICVGGK
jgi:hypothetical protein